MASSDPCADAGDPGYGEFALKDHLGLTIDRREPGSATARVTLDERHMNPNGVAHGAVLFAIMYRWAQRFMKEHTMDPGVGADRLVGLTAIVTAPIEPDDTSRGGRVSIDGEVWGALTEGAYRIADGARVRVLAMKGTRVVVEPVAPDHRPTRPAPGGEETP